ncbi:MAG: hypothetical protein IH804_03855, partial [Planctomycetes bacterium]|nr:hypothetical protein [Planctomycetota bacterium]
MDLFPPVTGLAHLLTVAVSFLAMIAPGRAEPPDPLPGADTRLVLRDGRDLGTGRSVRVGTYTVYEDREGQAGRTIDLDILILPATGPDRKPDPVFRLTGGPGQAATATFRSFIGSWMNEDR